MPMPRGAEAVRTLLLCVAVLASGCSAGISPLQIEAAQTAARVKTALVNDELIGVRIIDVRVRGGVVELSGRVMSQAEADRAAAVARAVPGVAAVESQLRIGGDGAEAVVPPPDRAAPARRLDLEFAELESEPSGLAIGAALNLSNQRGPAGIRLTLSPLIRLGSGSGFGPAIAFNWFHAEPLAPPDATGDVGRLRVRPIMAGIRYTLPVGRLSIAPSVVGGWAFNSLTLPASSAVERLSVGIDNSFAWRPGVSFWLESSRRTALHLSLDRVFTRPGITVVEDGRLRERTLNADTTLIVVGLAYKPF